MTPTSRRSTLVWLIAIGLLLSIVFISEAATAPVQLGLLALYGVLVTLALMRITVPQMRQRLNKTRKNRRRIPKATAEGSTAAERARALGTYRDRYPVLDVGNIVSEIGRGGMQMQRSRLLSLDDQGTQPYVVLFAHPEYANQTVIVRFELRDHTGRVQFINEDEVYLSEGENAIISSHRLPLRENDKLSGTGTWELRVYANGYAVARHNFGVSPSMEERRRFITQDREIGSEAHADRAPARQQAGAARLAEQPDDFDDEMPVSLEELLRGQGG